MILETTFLVDLEREAVRRDPGPAFAFLERASDSRLHIALISAGEMASGPGVSGRPAWEELFRRFQVLEPDREVAWRYGQTFRYLREQGRLIGSNDLWIAATALSRGMPVVTRNEGEFRRVPGLEVLGY